MPANLTTYLTQALNVVRQVYAYLGTAEAVTNTGGLPPKVRVFLGTTAGALLVVEHVLQAIQNPAKSIPESDEQIVRIAREMGFADELSAVIDRLGR